MIVAAAFCPPAPLLIPGLAPDLADELRELVRASGSAVAALTGADRVVVLSTGATGRPTRLGPGATVSASVFSRSDHPAVPPVRLPGGRASTGEGSRHDHDVARGDAAANSSVAGGGAVRPTVGTIVAAYLLHHADVTAPTSAVQLPAHAADIDASALAELLSPDAADPARRLGLLVMANGSAAHSEHAPGGDDPRSPEFDDDIVTAVSSGDPGLLARACERRATLAAELHDDTLPALAAFAALAADAGSASAELLHYSAPLGIGYLVAGWRWHAR